MLLGLFCLQWLSGTEQDTSSGSPVVKAHATSHCYLASPLWQVQTFPSSPIQENCGRRSKVEKEALSQDEKESETPSTISLKSH